MGNRGFVELMRNPWGLPAIFGALLLVIGFICIGAALAKAHGRAEKGRREELKEMLANGKKIPDREG